MPADDRSAAEAGTFAITRVFDASRERVWKAWSEADEMGAWWGPKACTVNLISFDFRPGGFFHYAMQFPNAEPMWGRMLFRDIAAPDRIVWLNSFSNEGCGITRAPFNELFPLEMHTEVNFIEQGERTAIALRARPHGASEAERAFFEGMFASLEQGFGGTFDQLTEHLAGA
jgi:uncharacterized protein YndB with AHSA1/START domain